MTNKCTTGTDTPILIENDKIITKPENICDIFNNFFVNAAKDLSEPDELQHMSTEQINEHYANHASIVKTKKRHGDRQNTMKFEPKWQIYDMFVTFFAIFRKS